MSAYVVTAELDWTELDRIRKMTPDEYAVARSLLTSLELPEYTALSTYYPTPKVMTGDEHDAIVTAGFKTSIKKVKGLHYSGPLPSTAGAIPQAATNIVNISVSGGVALMSIDTVTWLEDACTMDLQHHLDEGWRILAVCPPNDTRRPTYVLGRVAK